jgi:hypothetical protein
VHLFTLRFRHVRKRLAACFLWLILVSRPVRQALALDTLESSHRPFPIGHAKAGTIVIAELEFRQITLQVLFTAERIGAAHTPLEYAKEVFDVIRGEASGIDVLASAVVQGLVGVKLLAKNLVKIGLVSN